MLESCSSHLVGLNTVMGNTKIKVEYRGRDIIGETNLRESRVGERRRERGAGRDEERRREEREKVAIGIIAVYFRKRVRGKNWRKLYEMMGANFSK